MAFVFLDADFWFTYCSACSILINGVSCGCTSVVVSRDDTGCVSAPRWVDPRLRVCFSKDESVFAAASDACADFGAGDAKAVVLGPPVNSWDVIEVVRGVKTQDVSRVSEANVWTIEVPVRRDPCLRRRRERRARA